MTLRTSTVVGFGRKAVCRFNGDAGPRMVDMPATQCPPDADPCPGCKHRTKCHTDENGRPDPFGCPTASAWRAAERAYAALTEGARP